MKLAVLGIMLALGALGADKDAPVKDKPVSEIKGTSGASNQPVVKDLPPDLKLQLVTAQRDWQVTKAQYDLQLAKEPTTQNLDRASKMAATVCDNIGMDIDYIQAKCIERKKATLIVPPDQK